MELWQLAMYGAGGVLLLLYFRRRASRLNRDE